MLTGFSTLNYLKSQLLPESSRLSEAYDAVLTNLGRGVAGTFDNYCQRKFARAVGEVEILPADKCQFLLSRFPIESISAIDYKETEALGWVAQTINTYVNTINNGSGVVYLPDGADAGPFYAQLRFTYTGGYWIDDTDDLSGAVPAGQIALPDVIRAAWLLQCREVWNQTDKLGGNLVADVAKQPTFKNLELVPQVKQDLGSFVRFNLV